MVVHVVQDLSVYMGMALDIVPLAEWLPRREAAAREQLQALCEAAFDNSIAYDMELLNGHPVAEIHRVIQERGVDCLVMGADGSDRPEHQFFGSTAERLLHLMPCQDRDRSGISRRRGSALSDRFRGDVPLARDKVQDARAFPPCCPKADG